MAIIDKIQQGGTDYDIGASAENVSYGNSNVKTALDAMAGGSGKPVPTTDTASSIDELKRVFTVDSYQEPSGSGWAIKMEDFISRQAIDLENQQPITLTLEVWNDSGETLGDDAISQIWFFGKSWLSINHVWNGKRDLYIFSAKYLGSTSQGVTKFMDASSFCFRLPSSSDGHKIKVAAYVDYSGTLFRCKTCGYTLTDHNGTIYSMGFRNEWEDDVITVGKFPALADNHMISMCSAGSEYDPFLEVNTNARVIVTIMSDDGQVNDYNYLAPMVQGKVDVYNELHQDDEGFYPATAHLTFAVPSQYVRWDETHLSIPGSDGGSYMTARMLRDLVANYGASIMSHGFGHEKFAGHSDWPVSECERLVGSSRVQLERQLGVPCYHFCYPGGGTTDNAKTALKRHFLSAATTEQTTSIDLMLDINTKSLLDKYAVKRVSANNRFYKVNGVSTPYTSIYGHENSPWQLDHIDAALAYVQEHNESVWIVFYTHGQYWFNTGSSYQDAANLQNVVEYCLANRSNIAMLNYSEAFAEMYPAIDRLKALLGINS